VCVCGCGCVCKHCCTLYREKHGCLQPWVHNHMHPGRAAHGLMLFYSPFIFFFPILLLQNSLPFLFVQGKPDMDSKAVRSVGRKLWAGTQSAGHSLLLSHVSGMLLVGLCSVSAPCTPLLSPRNPIAFAESSLSLLTPARRQWQRWHFSRVT